MVRQVFLEVLRNASCLADDSEQMVREMEDIENVIFNVGIVIDSFQDNVVTNKLDLPSLMEFLAYAHSVERVPAESLARCFGLAVVAGDKILGKKETNRSRDEDFIKVLRHYFNEDGTFRYNEHVVFFDEVLQKLRIDNGYLPAFLHYLGVAIDCSALMRQFVQLLDQNNKKIEFTMGGSSSVLRIKKALEDAKNNLVRYSNNKEIYASFARSLSMAFDHEKCIKPVDLEAFLGILQTVI
ncbi:MAG: hypothetical protein K2M17_06225, partial [Bacilli bacterium]|nr:hypothetical protein [Bacilli bacterium]